MERRFILRIGKLHQKDLFEISHVFVHLLLAVAGSLADYHIREIEEGALVGYRKTIAGFDQRAEVLGKILFCIWNGFIRGRA